MVALATVVEKQSSVEALGVSAPHSSHLGVEEQFLVTLVVRTVSMTVTSNVFLKFLAHFL